VIIQYRNNRSLIGCVLILTEIVFNPPICVMAQNTIGDVNNNTGIVTQGQTGNNTLTIIQAPPPQFRFLNFNPITQNSNGSFARVFTAEIVAPYSPGTLVLAVTGKTVRDISVNPLTQGMAQYGSWTSGETHFVRIQNPFGRFEFTVTTSDSTAMPSVEIGFNQ
jgi:hypothetical protein